MVPRLQVTTCLKEDDEVLGLELHRVFQILEFGIPIRSVAKATDKKLLEGRVLMRAPPQRRGSEARESTICYLQIAYAGCRPGVPTYPAAPLVTNAAISSFTGMESSCSRLANSALTFSACLAL